MAPPQKVYADVRITGFPEHVNKMLNVLRLIQFFGDLGTSRTIKIWVDGDGAARMKVERLDGEKMPEVTQKTVGESDEFKFYLD
jgi:hypothetical protein